VLGADAAFASGEKLPERVDAVMESVGEATWSHSLRSLRPGGKLVVAGATTGAAVDPELGRVFLNQIQILGCALGTIHELRRLVALCDSRGITPEIDSTHPLADVRAGISRMLGDDLFGKVIITPA
jgi:D-arabinose 1-dehydrogenase-like Zn-dependent alcohol dehydrogenase